jgi:hypothetical protein
LQHGALPAGTLAKKRIRGVLSCTTTFHPFSDSSTTRREEPR